MYMLNKIKLNMLKKEKNTTHIDKNASEQL